MTRSFLKPRFRSRAGLMPALAFCLLQIGEAGAQQTPLGAYAPDAFLDPTAESLFRSAQLNWYGIDTSVVRYTALIKQRIGAGIRTPLKDRTIFRNETAVRAFWDRDHDALIQVLGARSQHPGREEAKREENWGPV